MEEYKMSEIVHLNDSNFETETAQGVEFAQGLLFALVLSLLCRCSLCPCGHRHAAAAAQDKQQGQTKPCKAVSHEPILQKNVAASCLFSLQKAMRKQTSDKGPKKGSAFG